MADTLPPEIEQVFTDLRALLSAKNHDYSRGEVFTGYRAAEAEGLPGWRNASGRLGEKYSRYQNLVRWEIDGNDTARVGDEGLEQTALDILGTLVAVIVLHRQARGCAPSAAQPTGNALPTPRFAAGQWITFWAYNTDEDRSTRTGRILQSYYVRAGTGARVVVAYNVATPHGIMAVDEQHIIRDVGGDAIQSTAAAEPPNAATTSDTVFFLVGFDPADRTWYPILNDMDEMVAFERRSDAIDAAGARKALLERTQPKRLSGDLHHHFWLVRLPAGTTFRDEGNYFLLPDGRALPLDAIPIELRERIAS